jgi:hypothetical protein
MTMDLEHMSAEEFVEHGMSRILQLVNDATEGRIRLLLAVRQIVPVLHGSQSLEKRISPEDFRFLIGVRSECDELPLGDERQYWAPESLREKDLLADKYEAQIGDRVRSTFARISTCLLQTHVPRSRFPQ